MTHIFHMDLPVFACLVSSDGRSFRVFAVVKVTNEKSFVVTGIRYGRQGNYGSVLAEAGIL